MAASFLRRLAGCAAIARIAAIVERIDDPPPRILRVLTYHRVDAPEPFASHVEHVAANARAVSIADVLAALGGGPPLPRRAVLLTFDDGYRSFAEVAWPILRAHGLPAALFVPTAFPDRDRAAFWWDRLDHALRRTAVRWTLETEIGRLPMDTPAQRARTLARLRAHVRELPHADGLAAASEICEALRVPEPPHDVLGWDELRRLAAEGVAIGAHSRTHPRLDRIGLEELRDEVLGSLQDVAREIPGAPRIFAYPDGRHDETIVALLRSAGTALAFTTRRGRNDLRLADPLRLRRLHVDACDPLPIVRAKLAATASFLDPLLRGFAPRPATAARTARRSGTQPRPAAGGARGTPTIARSLLLPLLIPILIEAALPGCVRPRKRRHDDGVWISRSEILRLPVAGPAWETLLAAAREPLPEPSLADRDSDCDVAVLARALVHSRVGGSWLRDQALRAIAAAMGTESGGDVLALSRNVPGYVIAAGLLDPPPELERALRRWLRELPDLRLAGRTMRGVHEERPNNWGTHAGAARAVIAAYLDDRRELARVAQVFRGWLGDRDAYAGFSYGDLDWQADAGRPVGINPAGAVRDGRSIDGVLPDDQRRGGGFQWPPPKENYVYEALQGALLQAMVLARAGYEPWEWSDRALLRAALWLEQSADFPAEGDDGWQPWVINHVYGTRLRASPAALPGKSIGWTAWTLGPR